jgi:hypothetical protein
MLEHGADVAADEGAVAAAEADPPAAASGNGLVVHGMGGCWCGMIAGGLPAATAAGVIGTQLPPPVVDDAAAVLRPPGACGGALGTNGVKGVIGGMNGP